MPGLENNDFSSPDEVRRPENTTVEVVKIGGGEIGRYTFQPGWRWADHIKPIVGTDSCQTEHVGYIVSGTLHVESDDGRSGDVTSGSGVSHRARARCLGGRRPAGRRRRVPRRSQLRQALRSPSGLRSGTWLLSPQR